MGEGVLCGFPGAAEKPLQLPCSGVQEDKATEARRVFGEALRAAEGAHLESMAAFDKYWQIKEVEREARTLCGKQAQEADPLIRAVQAKVRLFAWS